MGLNPTQDRPRPAPTASLPAALTGGRRAQFGAALLSLVLFAVWGFPSLWYSRRDSGGTRYWLADRTELAGWKFESVPVSKMAESVLVADALFSGEFKRPDGRLVRLFSAGRHSESGDDIGLFVHTPDRCWTESGWRLFPTQPELVEISANGLVLRLERRVFEIQGRSELVYFGGLVGGEPLPYRLDHNLSVGMKHALRDAGDSTGTVLRASDGRFWTRVWEAFVSRRPLLGAKQFLRVSTPVTQGREAAGDDLLREFLTAWISPAVDGPSIPNAH